jgi:HPt (histidine-containing phosphotransfer) domain-containing protein
MDMQMPVMDALAATAEIRRYEKAAGLEPTPILALTAHVLRETVEKTVEAGCTAYLSKPIKKAALLDALREHAPDLPAERPRAGSEVERQPIEIDPAIAHLVPGFLQNRHNDVQAILEAIERDDYDAIFTLGHSMKGCAGGYGFHALTNIGYSIEKAARVKNAEEVLRCVDQLSEYLGRVEVVVPKN